MPVRRSLNSFSMMDLCLKSKPFTRTHTHTHFCDRWFRGLGRSGTGPGRFPGAGGSRMSPAVPTSCQGRRVVPLLGPSYVCVPRRTTPMRRGTPRP